MKSVSSRVYDKNYYLNFSLGYEEFAKFTGGKVHPRIKQFASFISPSKDTKILDIGCGRGDFAFECARKGAYVVGIDYSKDAIEIANKALKKQKKEIQNRVRFIRMNARVLKFGKNQFDTVTAVDVFEHLYKDELNKVMDEISRVLKPAGKLMVHTETNKIYLDFTHKIWSYPMDLLLTSINKITTGKEYPGLSWDPRNDLHKIQHVNEPTYFYLKNLFIKHNFLGEVRPLVQMKPLLSWKDLVHNSLVSLYPISTLFPLHILFAHDYLCIMYNAKKS